MLRRNLMVVCPTHEALFLDTSEGRERATAYCAKNHGFIVKMFGQDALIGTTPLDLPMVERLDDVPM